MEVHVKKMMISVLVGTMLAGFAFADGKVKATTFVNNGKNVAVSASNQTTMVVSGSFTNGTATVSWAPVFSSAPQVILMWNEDVTQAGLVTSNALGVINVTTGGFAPKVRAPVAATWTNISYIAIGTAP
jgi:hypothetical protein